MTPRGHELSCGEARGTPSASRRLSVEDSACQNTEQGLSCMTLAISSVFIFLLCCGSPQTKHADKGTPRSCDSRRKECAETMHSPRSWVHDIPFPGLSLSERKGLLDWPSANANEGMRPSADQGTCINAAEPSPVMSVEQDPKPRAALRRPCDKPGQREAVRLYSPSISPANYVQTSETRRGQPRCVSFPIEFTRQADRAWHVMQPHPVLQVPFRTARRSYPPVPSDLSCFVVSYAIAPIKVCRFSSLDRRICK
jgi:hypothetical protein